MDSGYFGISPLLIRPDTAGPFPVFLRQGKEHVLYTRADERFTPRHKSRLLNNGIEQVFVGESFRTQYKTYVRDHLGDILGDTSIPTATRGETLYEASRDMLKASFHEEIAGPFKPESYDMVADLARQSVDFLSTPEGLKAVAPLIRRDYETYTHCLHSFAYSTAVLGALGLPKDELSRCGIGALLHDLGKLNVPEAVLHKPGPLTKEERKVVQTHPLHGVGMLTALDLPRGGLQQRALPPRTHGRRRLPLGHAGRRHPQARPGADRLRHIRRPELGPLLRQGPHAL